MRRRYFITLVGATANSWPIAARAQQSDRKRLVGLVTAFTGADMRALSETFRERMKELGRVDTMNVNVEVRTTAGNHARKSSKV